ncbi:DUF938 domain-containing protein [Alteromonas halophila]|uniref:DUF938 domain-containing protein n=1 Tax=Alteromonas halophila TaxID=516698 RepID=A0A918JCD7_9ALTE|nr:DUF938 domain-containing protein [Alteromonas halophila]GGW73846.1 hypothetical protein GCM10007391_01930 [Alteromonas halophila]
MDKPFSQACENNKGPILQVLRRVLADKKRVLEIGSGTGQHAVHFAANLPHLTWQTSDQRQYHSGIHQWLADAGLDNVRPPQLITIGEHRLPANTFDAVYSANTAHIMQPHEVKAMMQQVAAALPEKGVFCQYGPFLRQGKYSSQSNRDFDASLRAQGYGGYRDIEELQSWADTLIIEEINTMPANNLLLIWRRV